jgi:hypothetical protein
MLSVPMGSSKLRGYDWLAGMAAIPGHHPHRLSLESNLGLCLRQDHRARSLPPGIPDAFFMSAELSRRQVPEPLTHASRRASAPDENPEEVECVRRTWATVWSRPSHAIRCLSEHLRLAYRESPAAAPEYLRMLRTLTVHAVSGELLPTS